MKKPSSNLEKNLVKGALRRVFSRSELRKQIIEANVIHNVNPLRPKVKRWAYCSSCGIIDAVSNFEVDHIEPFVPLDTAFVDMEWDDVFDRLWCDPSNLQCVCADCHRIKSAAETKERKQNKKGIK